MKDVIAGFRVMTGLRQEDMAEKFGITRQAYWNKESGRSPFTDNEKIIFLNEVSKVYPEVTMQDIFFRNKVGK